MMEQILPTGVSPPEKAPVAWRGWDCADPIFIFLLIDDYRNVHILGQNTSRFNSIGA